MTKEKGDDDDADDKSCCAPSSFSITYQTIPNGGGEIFYDADLQLMHVDFTQPGEDYSMYLNFSSGIEWLFNPRDGSCTEYGLDPWIEWCFGKDGYSETYAGEGECGDPIDEDCLAYTNGDWVFAATTEECYPAAINGTHGNGADGSEYLVFYFGGDQSPIDPDFFNAPCQEIKKGEGYAPLDIAAVKATPAFHRGSHKAAKSTN